MLDFILSDEISLLSIIIFVLMLATTVWLFMFIFKALKGRPLKQRYSFRETSKEFDGIKEGDEPAPFGMHVIFGLIFLFSIWYMAFGYPIQHDHSIGWYNEEVDIAQKSIDEKFSDAPDNILIDMGESVFNSKCAICHGLNGRGLNGVAANLIDYGSEVHILYVIKNGSRGFGFLTPEMPAQYDVLGETEEEKEINARNAAAYVYSLSGGQPTIGDVEAGKEVFNLVCFACHGPNGQGNGPTGEFPGFAADLTKYGTHEYIVDTIDDGKNGKIGNMPSFAENGLLSNIQLKAVAKYVEHSLK